MDFNFWPSMGEKIDDVRVADDEFRISIIGHRTVLLEELKDYLVDDYVWAVLYSNMITLKMIRENRDSPLKISDVSVNGIPFNDIEALNIVTLDQRYLINAKLKPEVKESHHYDGLGKTKITDQRNIEIESDNIRQIRVVVDR